MTCTVPLSAVSPKREAILDGAVKCFLEHGYAATSMDSVAAAASVSKATIYAHFSSKADLFAAVISRRCEDDLVGDDHWPEIGDDAQATLMQLGRLVLSFMIAPNTLAIHRVVVAEAARQPDLANAFWVAGPGRACDKLFQLFAELDQKKLLRIPDPKVAALTFVNMLKAEVFFCRLLGLPEGTERMGVDQTIETAVALIMKGYAPD